VIQDHEARQKCESILDIESLFGVGPGCKPITSNRLWAPPRSAGPRRSTWTSAQRKEIKLRLRSTSSRTATVHAAQTEFLCGSPFQPNPSSWQVSPDPPAYEFSTAAASREPSTNLRFLCKFGQERFFSIPLICQDIALGNSPCLTRNLFGR
jgi:hypothetical protein